MPNLPAHIHLARLAAEEVRHPALESHMGNYLLGATAPDIRVITRGQRQQYHFAPLDFAAVGDGVKGLLEAHPGLVLQANGDGPTVAFIAGYVTHLVLDEVWIVDMYRPYFGNSRVFEDQAIGKVMDRALQLELDRLSQESVDTAVKLLDRASDDIEVGFIAAETLDEWRLFVVELVRRGFTWDRLSFMARRISAGDDAHPAHNIAEEFLRDVPAGFERLYERVPHVRLADFMATSVRRLAGAVGDYLSGCLGSRDGSVSPAPQVLHVQAEAPGIRNPLR